MTTFNFQAMILTMSQGFNHESLLFPFDLDLSMKIDDKLI